MTIDCARCGLHIIEAARLQGTMEKLCQGCGAYNKITGTLATDQIQVKVEAGTPPVINPMSAPMQGSLYPEDGPVVPEEPDQGGVEGG